MHINLELLLELIASFAIGSVPFAVVAMWGSGTDIRSVGSGNPGFNNVLRVSKRRALVALIGDTTKGWPSGLALLWTGGVHQHGLAFRALCCLRALLLALAALPGW